MKTIKKNSFKLQCYFGLEQWKCMIIFSRFTFSNMLVWSFSFSVLQVLYKSRCDNKLNDITERASADKREVLLKI